MRNIIIVRYRTNNRIIEKITLNSVWSASSRSLSPQSPWRVKQWKSTFNWSHLFSLIYYYFCHTTNAISKYQSKARKPSTQRRFPLGQSWQTILNQRERKRLSTACISNLRQAMSFTVIIYKIFSFAVRHDTVCYGLKHPINLTNFKMY